MKLQVITVLYKFQNNKSAPRQICNCFRGDGIRPIGCFIAAFGHRRPRSSVLGMLRFFFLTKKWYVVFSFFFVSSSVIIAFVATRQLCRSATRKNKPCGRHICCVQVELLLSLGPPMVSVLFRVVRSRSFCSSGCWLRLFVARFWQFR